MARWLTLGWIASWPEIASKNQLQAYGSYDRYGRYGGYDALTNPPHVVRLDEQSKDPKRSPESPHPMSEENQNRNRPRQALRARGRASEQLLQQSLQRL